MISDIKNNLTFVHVLANAARTNGTVNTSGLDRLGYERAAIVLKSDTLTDGSHAVTLEDSPDNSAWAAVAAADYNRGASATLATTEDSSVAVLEYIGIKRYIRAAIVTTGATTGGVVGAVGILAGARHKPVTEQS